MLTMALQIVVQHDCRSTRSTKDYLGVLGYKHHQRGISKDDYDKFKAALLASLSGFHGASWHQSLEQEWSTAYDHAIETMLEGCAKE